MRPFFLAALLAAVPSLVAQNLVPEGDFEQGGATWTRTAFNDPLGTTGFVPARVQGQGPSLSVFADFQTLSPVMSATFRSQTFTMTNTSEPVGFAVAWEKQVTAPIPSVTVNRVELRVLDASLTQIAVFTLQAPNQTGLIERASFSGTLTVAAPGTYTVDLFLRHSNLAGIPFTCRVDDVFIGEPSVSFFGQGCPGTGGFVPVLHTNGRPAVGNAGFAIELFDAVPSTVAFCAIGFSNTTWAGGTLPFAFGGGCDLLVDPLALQPHLVMGPGPGQGTASQPLAVPNNTSFIGIVLFTQWGVQDAAATNPFGFVTTAGMRFEVQP